MIYLNANFQYTIQNNYKVKFIFLYMWVVVFKHMTLVNSKR